MGSRRDCTWILGLPGFRVAAMESDGEEADSRVRVRIEHRGARGYPCGRCGGRTGRVRSRRDRTWDDFPWAAHPVTLVYGQRRVRRVEPDRQQRPQAGFAPVFLQSDHFSSHQPVVFALGAGSIGCSVSGSTVTITGATDAGNQCTIVASQGGNANYAPADVSRSFSIAKATQTISFGALSDKTYGNAPFALTATAPGGTVTFALAAGSAGCSLSGGTAAITGATGAGEHCTIVASQGGSANHSAATDVSRSFAIAKANQTVVVTTPAPSSAIYDTTFNTAASGGGSGNPVAITTAGVCSVSSGGAGSAAIQMTSGTGTCSVYYNQAGNANYSQVVGAIAAEKTSQTIVVTTGAPAAATFGTSFVVAATGGGSGNPVAARRRPVTAAPTSGRPLPSRAA